MVYTEDEISIVANSQELDVLLKVVVRSWRSRVRFADFPAIRPRRASGWYRRFAVMASVG